MIVKVKATNQTATGEFDAQADPVFSGPCPDECDGRVELPDGRLVYAIDDECGCAVTPLYTHAVAMDAGDNVRRRYAAADRPLAGITSPTGPNGTGLSGGRGQLHLVGEKRIGWLK